MAMLLFLAYTINAQTSDESHVKIFKTPTPGIIRVHYPIQTSDLLVVKFITENGLVSSDRIKGTYPKGLAKHYDVRNIITEDFWIEISSSRMTLTYHITPSKDKQDFTTFLEKTTYNEVLVKANN
jgi:hypothetical protein